MGTSGRLSLSLRYAPEWVESFHPAEQVDQERVMALLRSSAVQKVFLLYAFATEAVQKPAPLLSQRFGIRSLI